MAVINALNGKVTSWDTTGSQPTDYSGLLDSMIAEADLTFNMEGSDEDVTVFGSSGVIATSSVPTPRAYSVDISGYFPNSPANGTKGDITFSSGYVAHAHSWNVDISWAEHDVTEFDGTGITDRLFIAGLASWSGSWTCYLDDTTAISDITSGTGSAAQAIFQLVDHATQIEKLTGNIITTGASLTMTPAGVPTITYQFKGSGQLTANASATNIGADSNGIFDDSAGTLLTPGLGQLLWQTTTSRTIKANAFARRVSFASAVNGMNTCSVSARISGGLVEIN